MNSGGDESVRKRGFTLIEIIAGIAIIIILAAVVFPAVFHQIVKGRVSRLISEAEVLRKASLEYFGDVESWPRDPAGGTDNSINQLLNNPVGMPNWKGPYLDKPPRSTGGRYVDSFGGCLMLNDTDVGDGDDSEPDRNGNGNVRDRFVYFGDLPAREANLMDVTIDGETAPNIGDPSTGVVIQINNTGSGTDPCSGKIQGTDWRTDPSTTPETALYIFSEGT